MSQENDSLRSFLFAFVGLEVLVNKVGKQVEKHVVSDLSRELGFSIESLTWPAARDADSPWRNLSFRFSLLSISLDREKADEDLAEFKSLADARNKMAHASAGPTGTTSLPGDRAIALLRKYVALVAKQELVGLRRDGRL